MVSGGLKDLESHFYILVHKGDITTTGKKKRKNYFMFLPEGFYRTRWKKQKISLHMLPISKIEGADETKKLQLWQLSYFSVVTLQG